MKPQISDRPIHACGVRWGWESSGLADGGEEAEVDSSLLIMPTSPGAVGVTGGFLDGESGSMASMFVPSGITGPGRALKGFAPEVSRRQRGSVLRYKMPSAWCKFVVASCSIASGILGIMLFRTCASPV